MAKDIRVLLYYLYTQLRMPGNNRFADHLAFCKSIRSKRSYLG